MPLLIGSADWEDSLLGRATIPPAAILAPVMTDIEAFRAAYDGAPDDVLAHGWFRDGAFIAPTRLLADRMAQVGQPGYVYLVDYVAEQDRGQVPGAALCSVTPYVFGNYAGRSFRGKTYRYGVEDRAFGGIIGAAWLEFARSGVPAAEDPDAGIIGENIKKEAHKAETKKAPPLLSLLRYLVGSPATDMLLTAGVPPSIKLSNDLKRAAMNPLTPLDCERYARELMSGRDWEAFIQKGDYDLAVTYPELGRFRVNLYRQRNSISITLRRIVDILPSLNELKLPEWIEGYAMKPQGFILISGPAGHGKTTTLAAMVDIINTHRGIIIAKDFPVSRQTSGEE